MAEEEEEEDDCAADCKRTMRMAARRWLLLVAATRPRDTALFMLRSIFVLCPLLLREFCALSVVRGSSKSQPVGTRGADDRPPSSIIHTQKPNEASMTTAYEVRINMLPSLCFIAFGNETRCFFVVFGHIIFRVQLASLFLHFFRIGISWLFASSFLAPNISGRPRATPPSRPARRPRPSRPTARPSTSTGPTTCTSPTGRPRT